MFSPVLRAFLARTILIILPVAPLANTSPTVSGDAVRPPKIKLFVREDPEFESEPNIFGADTELEPRRKVFDDWVE